MQQQRPLFRSLRSCTTTLLRSRCARGGGVLGDRIKPTAALPASSTICTNGLTSRMSVRHSTIWRKVQETMHDKAGQKEEEQFQGEMQRLASLEKYDLRAFKEAMETAEKGSWFSWVNKVPGVNSMPEVQMGERYKKILGALKEEELRRPELIKAREKQRIATASGESVQEINHLLTVYENSLALHKWIRRRVQDKKELPKTKSECQVLMMGDPAGISVSAFQQKQQKRASRRGTRLPF